MLPFIQRIEVRHVALAPLNFFPPPELLDEIGTSPASPNELQWLRVG